MKKILIVFGTRPEAIKMCPLVKELKRRSELQVTVCVTAQHREMLDSVLHSFAITPDIDLSIMKSGQSLFDISTSILSSLEKVLSQRKPDIILVHGDTTTAFIAALAAFYMKIDVAHIEAGLRTEDIYDPYPEEFNRRAISLVAKYHFAPTEHARKNLLKEGVSEENIFVTGNTAIDALNDTVRHGYTHTELDWARGSRLILLTAHRRENLGKPIEDILTAVRKIADEHDDVKIIYPVHPNPLVRKHANILHGHERIRLIEPLDVIDFHNFMARSYLIITDSGGIQEEAPSLSKPVLVAREATERPEGVESGAIRLIGRSRDSVYSEVKRFLDDKGLYDKARNAQNPYGDGKASQRIASVLLEKLK